MEGEERCWGRSTGRCTLLPPLLAGLEPALGVSGPRSLCWDWGGFRRVSVLRVPPAQDPSWCCGSSFGSAPSSPGSRVVGFWEGGGREVWVRGSQQDGRRAAAVCGGAASSPCCSCSSAQLWSGGWPQALLCSGELGKGIALKNRLDLCSAASSRSSPSGDSRFANPHMFPRQEMRRAAHPGPVPARDLL